MDYLWKYIDTFTQESITDGIDDAISKALVKITDEYTTSPPMDSTNFAHFSRFMQLRDATSFVSTFLKTLPLIVKRAKDISANVNADITKESLDDLIIVSEYLYGVLGTFKVISRHGTLPSILYSFTYYNIHFSVLEFSSFVLSSLNSTQQQQQQTELIQQAQASVAKMRLCTLWLFQNMAILNTSNMHDSLFPASGVSDGMNAKVMRSILRCCSRTNIPTHKDDLVDGDTSPYGNITKSFIFSIRDCSSALRSLLFICSDSTIAKIAVQQGLANATFLTFLQNTGSTNQNNDNNIDNITNLAQHENSLGYSPVSAPTVFALNTPHAAFTRDCIRESLRTLHTCVMLTPPEELITSINSQLAYDFFARLSVLLSTPAVNPPISATTREFPEFDETIAGTGLPPTFDQVHSQQLFSEQPTSQETQNQDVNAFIEPIPIPLQVTPQSGCPELYPTIEGWKGIDNFNNEHVQFRAALDTTSSPSAESATSVASSSPLISTAAAATVFSTHPINIFWEIITDDSETSCEYIPAPNNPASCSLFEACILAAKCLGFCQPSHAPLVTGFSPLFPQGYFSLLASCIDLLLPIPSRDGHAQSNPTTTMRFPKAILAQDDCTDIGAMVFGGAATLLKSSPALVSFLKYKIFGKYADAKAFPTEKNNMIPIGAIDEKVLDQQENTTLRARCILLLLHPNVEVAQGVGQFLYTLCGLDSDELTRLVGFGRAAGVLAASGVPAFAQLAKQNAINF